MVENSTYDAAVMAAIGPEAAARNTKAAILNGKAIALYGVLDLR